MVIKEKLGPMWDYIQKVPDEYRVKYCLDIISEDTKYLRDEEGSKNLIREALRQLERFFRQPKNPYELTKSEDVIEIERDLNEENINTETTTEDEPTEEEIEQ